MMGLLLRMLCFALFALAAAAPARARESLEGWMWAPAIQIAGQSVTFPSHSPFTLADVGRAIEYAPPPDAVGTWFLPTSAPPPPRVPPLVILSVSSRVDGT